MSLLTRRLSVALWGKAQILSQTSSPFSSQQPSQPCSSQSSYTGLLFVLPKDAPASAFKCPRLGHRFTLYLDNDSSSEFSSIPEVPLPWARGSSAMPRPRALSPVSPAGSASVVASGKERRLEPKATSGDQQGVLSAASVQMSPPGGSGGTGPLAPSRDLRCLTPSRVPRGGPAELPRPLHSAGLTLGIHGIPLY